MAYCNGKSALVHALSAGNRVNLLKDHQSRELSQAVASPDAWSGGWDRLFVIGIWTHLKSNSLVLEDGFMWVEGKKRGSALSPLASPSPFPGPRELIGFRFRLLKQAAESGWGNTTPQAASAQTDLQVPTNQDQAQPGEGSLVHLEASLWYLSRGFESHALGASRAISGMRGPSG